jgi:hypothetical protein
MSFFDLDLHGQRIRVEDAEVSAVDTDLDRLLQRWLRVNQPGPADGWPTAAIAARLVRDLGAVIVDGFSDEGQDEDPDTVY